MSVAAGQRRPRAPPFIEPPGYALHRPEKTLLYQLVEQHYPAFRELRAMAGRPLPDYVQDEFDAYLRCGRLEEGFLRLRCEDCHAEKLVAFSCKKRGFCPSCGARRMAETAALLADEVLPERPLRQWVLSLPHALRFLLATDPEALTLVLGVVYRTISRQLLHKAGLTRSSGATGAVTLVQRFGSALNLNVHFHMLFLDGVYVADGTGSPVFRHLAGDGKGGPLDDLLGSSITYRIAVGARASQKLFTLQMVPPQLQGLEADPNGAAHADGFSLHAGIDIAPHQRPKLERLCRYVSRPPVATERMALSSTGHVRYQLKTSYSTATAPRTS
jgi:ribosomal protein S27E